jgi:hypothetical protein
MAPKNTTNGDSKMEAPFYKSEIEDIDFAVYDFVDKGMALQTKTNKGFERVPVIWAAAERANNVKNTDIKRTKDGMVIFPIITIERSSITRDIKNKAFPFAPIPDRGDIKGGLITINKIIKQDKTSNFANSDAHRQKKQYNFPLYRKDKNEKIVYETITIPIPVYVEVKYQINLITEYQEQMNDLLAPFIRRSHGHKEIMINYNNNVYEAFIDDEFKQENSTVSYEQKERVYKSTIGLEVLGYLIGDGKNQVRPRVVRRENPVKIRLPRERIIVGDIDGEFRF